MKLPAVAAAPQPGSAAGATSSSQFFAQTKKTQSNLAQQFSRGLPRAAARTSKFKQEPNVLDTFQIQQTGDQIRVVDADGSTYMGQIDRQGSLTVPAGRPRYARQEPER